MRCEKREIPASVEARKEPCYSCRLPSRTTSVATHTSKLAQHAQHRSPLKISHLFLELCGKLRRCIAGPRDVQHRTGDGAQVADCGGGRRGTPLQLANAYTPRPNPRRAHEVSVDVNNPPRAGSHGGRNHGCPSHGEKRGPVHFLVVQSFPAARQVTRSRAGHAYISAFRSLTRHSAARDGAGQSRCSSTRSEASPSAF